jgi:hypothetical protein
MRTSARLGLCLVLVCAAQCQRPKPDADTLAGVRVSFKLDPRLVGGTYGGERWVSQSTYTSAAQPGREATVEARVHGIDGRGRTVPIRPRWEAANPALVVVAPVRPGELDHVRITVKHPGETIVKMATPGISHELLVRASAVGDSGIQVEIVQRGGRP